MNFLSSLLPSTTPQGGYLPYWLLFISVVSSFNSCQTYLSSDLDLTKRVYEAEAAPQHASPQVTHLSARTFGTWTFIASVIRFYGAYHVSNKQVYELVIASFAVAGVHFMSEWLVYKTCRFGKGFLGPLVVSSTSLVWMTLQKDFYLSN